MATALPAPYCLWRTFFPSFPPPGRRWPPLRRGVRRRLCTAALVRYVLRIVVYSYGCVTQRI